MNFRNSLSVGLEVVLLVALIALLLGQVLGQPILLGFVESGSMEPTIDKGDGFIAVPSPLMGSVEEGDVVVFEAQELHNGGQTTHRVVEETDDGYITKGDANPFRDQDSAEPPVHEEQIVAKALQVNGEVVTIPALGTAVGFAQGTVSAMQTHAASILGTTAFFGTQGLLNLIVVTCVLLYVFFAVVDQQGRARVRDRSRETGIDAHRLVIGLTVLLIVVASATMLIPTGMHQVTVEATDRPATDDQIGLQAGESETTTIDVPNSGFLPAYTIFEPRTDGIEANPSELHISGHERAEVEITGTASADGGTVTRVLAEYRYLAILPPSLIQTLHSIHPLVPLAAINAVIAIPFYVLGVALIGTGRLRTPDASRDLSLRTRIRRAIRSLY